MTAKRAFWILLLIGVCFHLATIGFAPAHWQDEVQIHELGRRIIAPTDWTVYWLPVDGASHAATGLWNAASPLHEIAYSLLGHTGPRLVQFVFLVISTILLRAYLSRKTGDECLSTVFSLLYFSVPRMALSPRAGRLDAFVFMMLFAALYTLRSQWARRHVCGAMALAGAISAACVFSWATAIVLMPIVLWEIQCVFLENRMAARDMARPLLCFAVGGVCASLPFLALFISDLPLSWEIMRHMAGIPQPRDSLATFLTGIRAYPYLYVLGILGLCFRGKFDLLSLGAVGFLAVCVASRSYCYRLLYFLPYALIASATVASGGRKVARVFLSFAIIMATLSYVRIAVCKNAVEFMSRSINDERRLEHVLDDTLGRDIRVYAAVFDVYYAGRALGWRQYRSFNRSGSKFDLYPELIDKVDFFISTPKQAREHGEELNAAGFVPFSEIAGFEMPAWAESTWWRYIQRFSAWNPHPYGPYVVFRKQANESRAGDVQ